MNAGNHFKPAYGGLALALLPLAAAAQAPCETIRFKPGASSAELRGVAPAEGLRCFRFGTRVGQTVRVSIKSPRGQVAFSVEGLADAQDSFQFTSDKPNYLLQVFQLQRSAAAVSYVLTLSIK